MKVIKQLLKPFLCFHILLLNVLFTFRIRQLSLFFIISIILVAGCTSIYPPVPSETISYSKASDLIAEMVDQEEKVFSFYSLGNLFVKGWILKSEADILVAGIRDPFKLKIEITHPWGKPILHILINKKRIEVLSFNERRIYLGDFSPSVLSRFLPGEFFDHDIIWSFLRGYPHFAKHHDIETSGTNRISLLDNKRIEIETIDLYSETLLPKGISFPGPSLSLYFSEFKTNNGIYYADEVKANNIHQGKELLLKRGKIVFNETIPEEIFVMEKPISFEVIYLD